MSEDFGPLIGPDGTHFRVRSPDAGQLWLCLFDEADRETRLPMVRDGENWVIDVPGVGAGARYGLRADGAYDPGNGFWFDPDKLLLDPYARAIDRPFVYDPALAMRRGEGGDTSALMPKGMVTERLTPARRRAPLFSPGGLIYELQVRSFSLLHPDVPQEQRGTIAALRHPAIIDHLRRLHVGAVELMPITAWIDERHLGPLGLTNSWGYNPVNWFALDPRIAPGGMAELRATVDALHEAGIGVILDMVYNHTGESDALGPTLSLRGLDARSAFRYGVDMTLINDTGTGNSIDCNHPAIRKLILDSIRYFIHETGIDGFRFDLAPALGRLPNGFDPQAPLLREMREDPLLADRVMIAEPWDIGPGGYQLGAFGDWLEWNDRYRDDMRRFWRGDAGLLGALATRLAGSSDIFTGSDATRTLNFLAAHDGFTLADVTSYVERHNEANGEQNRDGHGENFSWNSGVEGTTDDGGVLERRRRDVKALLSTLFCSRGTIMLTAGDEFGRSQQGNNNAYAQDNELGWVAWPARDADIEAHVFALAEMRARREELRHTQFLTNDAVEWLDEEGRPLTVAQWEDGGRRRLTMRYPATGFGLCVNGSDQDCLFVVQDSAFNVAARSVVIFE